MHVRLFSALSASAVLLTLVAAIPDQGFIVPSGGADPVFHNYTIPPQAPASITYEVTCKVGGAGTFVSDSDIGTVKAGWDKFDVLSRANAGPYLGGKDETVFCTVNDGWGPGGESSENHRSSHDLKLAHGYCDECMDTGIGNGANTIGCLITDSGVPRDVAQAIFVARMYNGGVTDGHCGSDWQLLMSFM